MKLAESKGARSAGEYRPDIDGLRAVAVLAIVLYHAGFAALPGGFVGVDVFFVVSGFLIGSNVFRQLAESTFTLRGFFERRLRRIAPALTVALVGSSVAAWFVLLPPDLARFGASLVATVLVSSNLLFWRTAGYFDVAAESKPLLHTWSLGVEEQFYTVFPIVALLLFRYLRGRETSVYVIGFGISLTACVVLSGSAPDLAFYLMPVRVWELLLGVLIARRGVMKSESNRWRNTSAAAGMLCVLVSMTLYDARTVFPGTWAILPTFGAGLVIVSGGEGDTLVGWLLSRRPMVLVGKMSYSLYLWHWPALVLYRYAADRKPSPVVLLVLLAGVFAVSALSLRFIESPFRRRQKRIPYRTVVGAWLVTSALLLTFGTAAYASRGFPVRESEPVNRLLAGEADRNPDVRRCFSLPAPRVEQGTLCTLGPAGDPHFVLWGDSHADALMPLLNDVATAEGVSGVFAGSSGCVPLLGVRRVDRTDHCSEFNRAVVDYIEKKRIENVVMVAYWSAYTEGLEVRSRLPEPYLTDGSTVKTDHESSRVAFSRALRATVASVTATGGRILIVEQVPSQVRDAPTWAVRVLRGGGDPDSVGRAVSEHRQRQQFLEREFAAVSNQRNVFVADPASVLCTAAICPIAADGRSLYADYNHMSTFGSQRLRGMFVTAFSHFKKTVGPGP